jgi:hypothetical protein
MQPDAPTTVSISSRTHAPPTRDSRCQAERVYIQTPMKRSDEMREGVTKQANCYLRYYDFDEVDMMLMEEEDNVDV